MSTIANSTTRAPIEATEPAAEPMSIAKPAGRSVLDRFKSTKGAKIAGVEQLLMALPHHRLSETGDWARLHPDEDNYWSHQLYLLVTSTLVRQGADSRHVTRLAAFHS
jgi:hypothetical protein